MFLDLFPQIGNQLFHLLLLGLGEFLLFLQFFLGLLGFLLLGKNPGRLLLLGQQTDRVGNHELVRVLGRDLDDVPGSLLESELTKRHEGTENGRLLGLVDKYLLFAVGMHDGNRSLPFPVGTGGVGKLDFILARLGNTGGESN